MKFEGMLLRKRRCHVRYVGSLAFAAAACNTFEHLAHCFCIFFIHLPKCAQADVFSDYFRSTGLNVAYVEAKGAMFPVQTYYLEDILEVCA